MVKGQILSEYDKDVEAETEEEDWEDEMTTALEYMDTISVRRTRLKPALRMEDEDRQSEQSEHRTGSRPPRINTVKLPKLVIQRFSGQISEWQGFWSQYETTIYDNERLSKSDKFSYLKSFLTGTAANAVSGCSLCLVLIMTLQLIYSKNDLAVKTQ